MSNNTIKQLLLLILLLIGILPIYAQTEEPEPAWDGQSRFTVLVLGMDRRPSEGDTLAVRTDAMILVSIDPVNQRMGILHFPRDLFMIPPNNSDYVRINTLLQDGNYQQEGYGVYWIMDTFQLNLGMYIDRYVLFDFEAFITLIDALGGIEITTGYPIYDDAFPDMNWGYDPFELPAGTHLLNGYQALQFARTRHQDGDIQRGERQIMVMTAVQQKLTDPDIFMDLLTQAPTLYNELQGDVYTDLTLNDIIQLAYYIRLIPPENITTASLDENYQARFVRGSGGVIHTPDYALLPELLIQVFGEDYNQ
ncbi:MAG: LytR family transcriptional regulator [Chloroflexi bacterium]|nr:MAG: LytR family transcriptional regulator [Chloroflexota bacterium]